MKNSDKLAIRTQNLQKKYRDFWGRDKVQALQNLSIEVRSGEIFGLLGPNGSGKTTTIKILLGLVFPTSGQVHVLGQSPRSVQAKARIGYLPEESYLYRFLNAEETLDFYGRLFRIPRRERRRRAAELIDMVGLAHARKQPLREFSKGMSRRIGLAQALINDPELILLDEPTSGMDPVGTREVKDLILRLRDQNKTVLLCSHLLADVEEVCNEIAILKTGILEVSGPVDELLAVRDEIEIRLRRTENQTNESVRQAIESTGHEVLEIKHPRVSLEELFVSIVEKNTSEKSEPISSENPESKS
ncbi:MAG: ABC transporter ATP-binding protein [Planctomycetota bacterium]|jgi:ABC-2 type transport system ATP-binding protein|nr:ABC transporter ATP-binding protein [Planctomycetota bacterium]